VPKATVLSVSQPISIWTLGFLHGRGNLQDVEATLHVFLIVNLLEDDGFWVCLMGFT
jgi:hypothetical protein